MAELVLTYKESEKDLKQSIEYRTSATILAYLRCEKLHRQYLATKNSGVKCFFVAKDVTDIGAFGDVVNRVEYFDEGKLKTKLIFVRCSHLLYPANISKNKFKKNLIDRMQVYFESFLHVNKIFQPDRYSKKLPSYSKAQQETESELREFFNCNITDCEFLFHSNMKFDDKEYLHLFKPVEENKGFDITEEILGTKSSHCIRINDSDELFKCDSKYEHLKNEFVENFRIMLNQPDNLEKFIVEERQSSFRSELDYQMFKIKIIAHFEPSTCIALSEKTNLFKKSTEDIDFKRNFKELIQQLRNIDELEYIAEEPEFYEQEKQFYIERIDALLERYPRLLNSRDIKGKTPLHIACEIDETEAIECLIKYTESLANIVDEEGRSVLHCALNNENTELMKLLLDSKPEVSELINKQDVYGETVLSIACKYHKTKIVELLLSYTECLVDIGDEKNTKLTLHCAAENGYVDIMMLLLKCDAKLLNKQGIDGETALHLACAVGNIEVVTFLLTRDDLKLDLTDKWGNTCFHTAALSKDCNILSALLHKEPTFLDKTNYKGRTALHVAASIRNDNVIKFLLDRDKCNVNVQDINDDTPLHIYVDGYKHTYFDIRNTDINVFEHKCNSLVNMTNQDGDTPLHKAVKVSDHESVKKLVAMGADVNKKNNNEQTPRDLANTLHEQLEKNLILSYL